MFVPFRENVNLLVQDLTGYDLDLNGFVELSENQVNTMIPDGTILETKRINENPSNTYHKIIYTGKQGDFDLKFEQYYWVKNNKAYILTLTCETTQFNTYQKVGEQILNSFILK